MTARPAALTTLALFLTSCAPHNPVADPTRGLRIAEQSLGSGPRTPASDRPVAAVDGRTLGRDDLWPRLAEASGGEVLDEMTLDLRLERECAGRSLTITDADTDRERTLLAQALADPKKPMEQDELDRVVQRVRVQRGLGPVRFAAMLKRNAMLRALVRNDVTVAPEAVDRAYRLRYGPTYKARVITRITAHDAAEALDRLNAGEDFSKVAAELSTDSSASRGGVLSPINLADTTYPQALRDALGKLRPGEMAGPIALSGSFAIIRLDEIVQPTNAPSPAEARPELEAQERLARERELMDQFARRILQGPGSKAIDPSLRWSTDSRREP